MRRRLNADGGERLILSYRTIVSLGHQLALAVVREIAMDCRENIAPPPVRRNEGMAAGGETWVADVSSQAFVAGNYHRGSISAVSAGISGVYAGIFDCACARKWIRNRRK